ncbi:hypothetical protein [Pseudomonas panipatensis]|uniref:HNH endonuclease n=1 Tax=Pseudomonas panipatensis TaxID=428992 RepID=A0A1G8EML9_9PSED|nr:hypothetical protein [Pseudomonas panipatensis]SDH71082.1 hypothetical protein SAMN05216272_102659 [Pseudomonas panipatensis]SMP68394.1 hypothetical protein SAMN06295951_108171 [Pseudomonas panipatensis]
MKNKTNSTTKNSPQHNSRKTNKKSSRLNFSANTIKQIAFEAHLFCSNPTCCRFTSYATSNGKARAIAEAAHINAASPTGPRPNAGLTEEDLKSAANGIWLCKICHDKVDDDPRFYTETKLRNWKEEHSKFVKQLVGKDFDLVHFELYARSRNVAQSISILGFFEGKRVFFEALDVEHPGQVLESLIEIRSRINNALGQMKQEESASEALREINKKIRKFLTAHPRLNELKCDGSDPNFHNFCNELQNLRTDLLPMVVEMAESLEYTLSPELIGEHKRLQTSKQV